MSFDPETGKMEDLGRMHPTEMYARSLRRGAEWQGLCGHRDGEGRPGGVRPGDAHASEHSAGRRCASTAPGNFVGVTRRSDGTVYATCRTNLLRLDDETVTRVESPRTRRRSSCATGGW